MIFDIKLTSKCDSKCKFCHIWQLPVVHLDYWKMLDLLDKYSEHEFIFSGGECLLHPDIYKIITYASNRDINFLILTNGISCERVENAIVAGAKRFTISVDGINHDKIRGVPGNLEIIKKIIKQFGRCVDIRLAYTFSDANNFEDDKYLLKELISQGANDNIYFIVVQDNKSFNIKTNYSKAKRKIKPPINIELELKISKTTKKYLNHYFNKTPIKNCLSPQFYVSIFQDGNVRYCQSFCYDIILGNIYETDIAEILENSKWLVAQSNKCPFKKQCFANCHRRFDVKTKEELNKLL